MHRTLDDRVQIDLRMAPTMIDPSLHSDFRMTNLSESTEVMLMAFFVQERMNDRLTQMLHLSDLKILETSKHYSHLLKCIFLNMTTCITPIKTSI